MIRTAQQGTELHLASPTLRLVHHPGFTAHVAHRIAPTNLPIISNHLPACSYFMVEKAAGVHEGAYWKRLLCRLPVGGKLIVYAALAMSKKNTLYFFINDLTHASVRLFKTSILKKTPIKTWFLCYSDEKLCFSYAGFLWFLAVAFPFFGVINDLLGAFTTTFETFVIPPLAYNIYYQLKKAAPEHRDQSSKPPNKWVAQFFLFSFECGAAAAVAAAATDQA